jgi:hypothetical protein
MTLESLKRGAEALGSSKKCGPLQKRHMSYVKADEREDTLLLLQLSRFLPSLPKKANQ